ncbi:MAG: hypothetical protein AAGF73_05505 [Actinomycetota bacterium]
MRTPLLASLAAATIVIAACGSDDDSDTTAATDAAATATTDTTPANDQATTDQGTTDQGTTDAADAEVFVTIVDSEFGEILADANGFTLYGFTDDVDGVPTCEGGCAGAWPPLTVDTAEVPAGLDTAVFTVVEHPDGSSQLKAGDWPLYRFASDFGPGDVTGQGSGGVWFVVAPNGTLIGA